MGPQLRSRSRLGSSDVLIPLDTWITPCWRRFELVVLYIVVIALGGIVELGTRVARKVVRGTDVLLPIILHNNQHHVISKEDNTYSSMPLNDVVNVSRAILVQFDMMARTLLCEI